MWSSVPVENGVVARAHFRALTIICGVCRQVFCACQSSMSEQKTVLVHLGERVRYVKFQRAQDELIVAIRAAFGDVPGIADVGMVIQH